MCPVGIRWYFLSCSVNKSNIRYVKSVQWVIGVFFILRIWTLFTQWLFLIVFYYHGMELVRKLSVFKKKIEIWGSCNCFICKMYFFLSEWWLDTTHRRFSLMNSDSLQGTLLFNILIVSHLTSVSQKTNT